MQALQKYIIDTKKKSESQYFKGQKILNLHIWEDYHTSSNYNENIETNKIHYSPKSW